jgi:predicted SAM-dependent methyltransferase
VNWLRRRRRPRRDDARPQRGLRLHLGCGTIHLDGWVNIDLETRADLNLDIRLGLPFADGAARLMYHEHLIEHLTIGEACSCLADWHRVLEPNGVLRIATPDLAYLCERYGSGDWREQEWLRLPEFAFIRTRAEMMNVAFRWWDHQYLYDGEELERRLLKSGFTDVRRCGYRESALPELRGLETRPDSTLILEAVRP